MEKRVPYLTIALLMFQISCNSQGSGCTDPLGNNTDLSAIENDGSCTYNPTWVAPYRTLDLNEVLAENSGLILWDGLLWTHNDDTDTRLYGLDTSSAEISREYLLPDVVNVDWEEIAEDGEYIYLGDFGNNASGNRTDLHILRIEMGSLKAGDPSIDTIWFSYSDQHDLSSAEPNQTDFDCEAFVVSSNSIYLFTKQWLTGETSLYALSKEPGKHLAVKKTTFDIQGLVTGATFLESEHLLVLCGYTGILQPFFYLLYDYPGQNFFLGNKRKINISLPFHQVEGITSRDGLTYYLSNESFVLEPATNTPQQLHIFDLSELLGEYLKVPGI